MFPCTVKLYIFLCFANTFLEERCLLPIVSQWIYRGKFLSASIARYISYDAIIHA